MHASFCTFLVLTTKIYTMKSKLLMLFFCLSFFGCSVEDDGLENIETLRELDYSLDSSSCEPVVYNPTNSLEVKITNDENNLYITLNALDGSFLNKAAIHLASNENGFPTVGKGNLPHPKMEHQITFDPNTTSITLPYSIQNFDECPVIAAFITTTKGEQASSSWVGDSIGESGDWNYFEYCLQDCSVADPCEGFTAGSDKTVEWTLSQANAFPSYNYIENLLKASLQAGVSWNGTFSPSIRYLVENEYDSENPGTYTVTYTVSTENCVDSMKFTINIVEE